ncbi:adenylate/guanylate cyclase domain-containing protein [bacterium]|nr:adenylate/guanylate cyclase domain-containing protein [bacterium]
MIRIQVRNQRVNRSFQHAGGPIEFGRVPSLGSVPRFVLFDDAASKCHLRVTETADGLATLENLSQRSPISLSDGRQIPAGGIIETNLPIQATVGATLIDLVPSTATTVTAPRTSKEDVGYETIAAPIAFQQSISASQSHRTLIGLRDELTPERLLRWVESIMHVQKAAAGSPAFYQETVEALVEMVGMDQAMVLLREKDHWKVAGQFSSSTGSSSSSNEIGYSRSLVDLVALQKRTLFRNASTDDMSKSLAEIEAVVASPILSNQDEVIGVLYASRALSSGSGSRALGSLDAQVVQLLAGTVATGLARAQHEAEAIRNRAQFEQFFSRELASELERNSTLLEGQERELTLFFADIRGFSRLAQKLAPRDYYRIAQDILSCLTERVQEAGGVVVDYTGDGLMAMWNAPFDQPDHARRAAQAALHIVADLPQLQQRWQKETGGLLDLGIGINTGPALVGNTGTPLKLKYGPRGHHVNLGSRIEGATKHFGVRIIASASAADHAGSTIRARRLGRARLAGLTEPVELFEIYADSALPIDSRRSAYEGAYHEFEQGRFDESARILKSILADDEADLDVPTFQLLSRVIQCLKNPPALFDATWTLDSK